MNGWEIGLAFVVLILADVWLFWYAMKNERKIALRDAMRRKGNRSKTYLDKYWEDKRGKDRS